MSVTLETILGNTEELDESSVIYVQVNSLSGKKPMVTANFARNVSMGYVVVEAPENIERFLMDNFAEDEQDLMSVYSMEEEERVEDHNKREIQKIEGWEKNRDSLITGWRERESRRIPDWEERERKRHEEYDLEIEIKQEEAERAALSYADLIFEALESKGVQISAMRRQYNKDDYLSDLRQGWLRTFLSNQNIQDKNVIEDIVNLTRSRDPVLKEGLREILVEQLGVVFPEVKPLEPLPPYEPESVPESEPKSKPGPQPEINLIEPILLQKELESVVLAAYNGRSFEDINLTQQAWDSTGISPQQIYNIVSERTRYLNSKYMLVRVVGNGNGNIGSLTLSELDANDKKGLRQKMPQLLKNSGNFRRPADILEDAFYLSVVLHIMVEEYFSGDEETRGILESKKLPVLGKTIYEKIVGEGSMSDNVFHLGFSVDDVSKGETEKYEDIANRANNAIKEGLLDTEDNDAYRAAKMNVPVTKLVETIRYLIDSVPPELVRLRYLNTHIGWAKKELADMRKNLDGGKRLTEKGREQRDYLQKEYDTADMEKKNLLPQLGSLTEGSGSWNIKKSVDPDKAIERVNTYGLSGYRTNNVKA